MFITNRRTRLRAFTLMELLVVISIVALLIGILLPVLSSARERGRQIACASNVSQIGKAMEVYANEFRELYPLAGEAIPWGTPWDKVAGTHPGWTEQLEHDFGDKKGYACPSYPSIAPSDYNYFIGARAAFKAAGDAAASVNRRLVKYSSALVLGGDNTYNQFPTTDVDLDDYSQDCLNFAADIDHWAPHHGGGTLNVLFADSHVTSVNAFDPEKMTFRYASMSAW